jgi:hypothetical protein
VRLTSDQRKVLEINPELTNLQSNAIRPLDQHDGVKAWDINHIGKCNVVPFYIGKDARPIAINILGKSIYESETINEQVRELLKAGIIEPSRSSRPLTH